MFGKHIFNHWPNQMSRVLIVEKWTKVEKHENQMTVANDGSFRLLGVGEFQYLSLLLQKFFCQTIALNEVTAD